MSNIDTTTQPPTTATPVVPSTAGGLATQALGIPQGTTDDVARQMYGYMSWALDIPEVGGILRQAASLGWSQAQLESAIEKTDWWKTTDDSAKQWQQLLANNPGEANSQIAQKEADIRSALVQQGVSLDDARLQQVASSALQFGWDDTQTKNALDSELMRSPDVLQSQVGTNYKALAAQYAVPLSDPTIQQWAAHSISGVSSDEQFREYLSQQAQSRFAGNSSLTTFLQGGGTVDQYFDPYKQYAAQTLGVNPDTIDLTDPKWSAAINAKIDDKGTIGAMSYQQWVQYMKTNPVYNYDKTTQGRDDAYSMARQIGTLFGAST